MVKLGLCKDSKHSFYYYPCFLYRNMKDLDSFLSCHDDMNCYRFAFNAMIKREIQSNNSIEGIEDDLEVINHVIHKLYGCVSVDEKLRILNLYNGYRYIFDNFNIDEVHLRELYGILSNGLLDEYSIEHMGSFYRNGDVYIIGRNCFDLSRGIESSFVSEYMMKLFDYIKCDNAHGDLDVFLKSQIIHLYFVYVHPYFDVNGRTARTVSLWYLLNQHCYPFVVFNRSISYYREDYLKMIRKSVKSGNMTYFLKFMLVSVMRELEKECLVYSIRSNCGYVFSSEEEQFVELLLNSGGQMSFKDVMSIYSQYRLGLSDKEIYYDRIDNLVNRGIICISNDSDKLLSLNKKYMGESLDDCKYLKLKR